ncbi:helix-turn-helix domain-containing protein [Maribacter sp. 2-571]|uniref:response regulator n=1 Tax=Maribacter sp. 2-571 TaxID=3417569 RepID=UPI003D33605B
MKKKILIVEDEAIIASDLERIIRKNNWEPIGTCTSFSQAISKIDSEKPDLVLIDICLRGEKDGTDIARYLLRNDEIPYIYITSLSDTLTLDRVKVTRPMGYLLKPFKPEAVRSSVEIAFFNHEHRKIDPIRHEKEYKSDIPFRLRKVVDHITENLDKKLVVSELAHMTQWKFHHFIRNFKKYVGSTPYQYILEQRISRSRSLLEETNLPISSIAYDLGFQSHSNFCVAFYKNMKMSAEDYRKKVQISKLRATSNT